jgi:drug/metabolite transporter (DMT)-like permease
MLPAALLWALSGTASKYLFNSGISPFLNEIMSPLQMTGGVLVIASIVLLQLKQQLDDKALNRVRLKKATE